MKTVKLILDLAYVLLSAMTFVIVVKSRGNAASCVEMEAE